MTGGDQTPRGSGLPDPAGVSAPPSWGPAPRRWVPGPSWAGTTQTSDAPAARRSALTPLPEDDDEIVSAPRRSALSPRDDEELDDAVVPRRSALSPLPLDEQPATAARRSAFTPSEPDDDPAPRRSAWVDEDDDEDEDDGYEETLRLPLPRRSSEYATAARAIQPALPDLGPTPESPESPVEAFSPEEAPFAGHGRDQPAVPVRTTHTPRPRALRADRGRVRQHRAPAGDRSGGHHGRSGRRRRGPGHARPRGATGRSRREAGTARRGTGHGQRGRAPSRGGLLDCRRRHGHVAVRLGVLRCRPLALQAPSPRRARDRGRPDPDRHRRPGVRRAQGHLAEGEVDTEAQPHHPHEAEPRHVRASGSRRVARPQEAAHSFLGRLGPVARR